MGAAPASILPALHPCFVWCSAPGHGVRAAGGSGSFCSWKIPISRLGCAAIPQQLPGREGADAWHVAGTPQSLGLARGLGNGPEYQFPCEVSANICARMELAVDTSLPGGVRGRRVGSTQCFVTSGDAGGTAPAGDELAGGVHLHGWEGCARGHPRTVTEMLRQPRTAVEGVVTELTAPRKVKHCLGREEEEEEEELWHQASAARGSLPPLLLTSWH